MYVSGPHTGTLIKVLILQQSAVQFIDIHLFYSQAKTKAVPSESVYFTYLSVGPRNHSEKNVSALTTLSTDLRVQLLEELGQDSVQLS